MASKPLPTGRVRVRYEFTADHPDTLGTGGTGRLFVGDEQVGEGKLEHTVPLRFSGYAGLDVGRDNGLPVSPGYYYLRSRFPFAGRSRRSRSSCASGSNFDDPRARLLGTGVPSSLAISSRISAGGRAPGTGYS